MRQVYIDDDGTVRVFGIECTGVSARWCPVHGDCTNKGEDADEPYSDHCSEADCPLHGVDSNHAEGVTSG